MSEQTKPMSFIQKLEASRPSEIVTIPEVANRFKHLYFMMHRGNGEIRYEAEKFHFAKLLQEKTDLQQCTKLSLYGCFLDAAVNGLSFDPAAKHLYVVSFNINVGTKHDPKWEKRATLMVSGIGELMMRMKQKQIRYADNPVLVYEGDHFKFGTDRKGFYVEHTAAVPRQTDNIIACYIRLERLDGTSDYKVMTIDEIERLRKFSKDPNSKAWTDGLPGMIQAKVIKHAFRTYPKLQYGDFSTLASTSIDEEEQSVAIDYGIGNINTSAAINAAAHTGTIQNVQIHTSQQVMDDESFVKEQPKAAKSVVIDSEEF